MLSKDAINNKYFNWMYKTACDRRFPQYISYRKLFMHLHDTEFRYVLDRDHARYADGLDLRYRFAYLHPDVEDAERNIDGPCSVLEMMFSLAFRCEESIMDNTQLGDRTAQWLWIMITNMGLGSMDDDKYDRQYVDYVLDRFINREYEPDGKGGLFIIKNCEYDLRDVEIWWQMCWFLNSIS